MKGKSLFFLGSVVAAALLVGGTFAAWAVTDNADIQVSVFRRQAIFDVYYSKG